MSASTAETFDLEIPGGRVRAQRTGPADGDLVLLVHGLSGNLRGFDVIVGALAAPGRQVVAVDLRGRGRSEVTPPGTYGLDSHRDDVLAIADALGARELDYVGWSMGALIGMRVAAVAPERLRRVVLLDHAGAMDQSALDAILAGLARLDAVVPTPEAYLDALRGAGAISPWTDFWTTYFRYELAEQADGSWSPSTDRAACTEDVEATLGDDFRARWPALTMPALLVRALDPLAGGHIVPEAERDALREAATALEVVEVPGDHYTMMEAPETASAVARFLTG